MVFLITLHSPASHDDANAEKREHLISHLAEAPATDEDGADGIDEVVHGVDVSGDVRPFWHGTGRGEESTEQHDGNHEEPHDEDGLLHGVGIVGHDESER